MLRMYLIPLNCTLDIGQGDKSYVTCILSQQQQQQIGEKRRKTLGWESWVLSSSPDSVFKCVTLHKTADSLGMLTGPCKSHGDLGEVHTVAVLPAGHAGFSRGKPSAKEAGAKAVPAAAVGLLLPSAGSFSGFLGQLLGN